MVEQEKTTTTTRSRTRESQSSQELVKKLEDVTQKLEAVMGAYEVMSSEVESLRRTNEKLKKELEEQKRLGSGKENKDQGMKVVSIEPTNTQVRNPRFFNIVLHDGKNIWSTYGEIFRKEAADFYDPETMPEYDVRRLDVNPETGNTRFAVRFREDIYKVEGNIHYTKSEDSNEFELDDSSTRIGRIIVPSSSEGS